MPVLSPPHRAIGAPTGAVTLVFTDVQGSTGLWEADPATMRAAMAVHDRVLRGAIEACNGYLVKSVGDALMVAFVRPADAVRFCLTAQEALVRAEWPAALATHAQCAAVLGGDGAALHRGLRVRMGLHAGEPECRADSTTGRMDYFGSPVHRAARVADAAHGGQVLASRATWAATSADRGELGDPVAVDLGEHRLRGIEAAEGLVQVLPRSLAARRFGALRLGEARGTNLPADPTRFVGRAAELAEIERLFGSGRRVVTLLGPAGMGKTRLARAYAERHLAAYRPGGAWFCDLTEARDVDGICSAVGQALGVPLVATGAEPDPVVLLGRALVARGSALVIVDNFEQVVAHAPATLARWAADAPEAHLLVTSRERLRVQAEAAVELPPLSLPERGADLAGSEAAQLLFERVRQARPDLVFAPGDEDRIAEILRQLDGMPLAIELAAARMAVMSPTKLLQLLPRRFDLLAGGLPGSADRATTLRTAIAWSWDLLEPHERAALAQCATFRGGFNLEAAEAVVDLGAFPQAPWMADVVQSLRDKSLFRTYQAPELPEEVRLGLYESVREFAAEKLRASGGDGAAERRHAAYYVLKGAQWAEAVSTPDGAQCLRRLAVNRANLLAVHERALAESPAARASSEATSLGVRARAEQALRAALAADPILDMRGPPALHDAVLDRAIAAASHADADPRLLARALQARGNAHRARGRSEPSRTDLETAEGLAREVGDAALEARVVRDRAALMLDLGLVAEARPLVERALSAHRALADRPSEGRTLVLAGNVEYIAGDLDAAVGCYEAALAVLREVGDRRYEGVVLVNLAGSLGEKGQLDRSFALHEEALAVIRAIGDRRTEGVCWGNFGNLCQTLGKFDQAEANFLRGLDAMREVGDLRREGICTAQMAALALELGRAEETRRRIESAIAAVRAVGDRRNEGAFHGILGSALVGLGQLDLAAEAFDLGLATLRPMGDSVSGAAVALHRCRLDLARADVADGAGHGAAAAAIRERVDRIVAAAQAPGPPDAKHPQGLPPLDRRSDDARFALRMLERVRGAGSASPRGPTSVGGRRAPAPDSLGVGPGAAWFRPPNGERVDLTRRQRLREVLACLVDARAARPGTPVTLDDLFRAGWPGEVAVRGSATNRVHVALSTLRKLGLQRVLLSREGGYLLDPGLPLERTEPPVARNTHPPRPPFPKGKGGAR